MSTGLDTAPVRRAVVRREEMQKMTLNDPKRPGRCYGWKIKMLQRQQQQVLAAIRQSDWI